MSPTFSETVLQMFQRPENTAELPKDADILGNSPPSTTAALGSHGAFAFTGDDVRRLKLYGENTLIYKGEFAKVWPDLEAMTRVSRGSIRTPFTVQVLNDAQPITDAITNLLYREPPALNAIISDSQIHIDRLRLANDFDAEIKEAARQASFLGDAVALIWYGVRDDEAEARVHIRFVHPRFFVGVFNPLDRSVLEAGIIQHRIPPVKRSDGTVVNYLYRQIHGRGFIINELWEINKNSLTTQVPLTTLPQFAELEPFELTEVDELLVVHIKNMRDCDSPYGASDYTSALKTKFRARTEIMTQFNMVRAKHSNPKLAIPQSVFDAMKQIGSGNSTNMAAIPHQDLDVVATFPNEEVKYITWDGHLAAAKDQLDILQKQIWQEAKISPTLLGASSGGLQGGETGRANVLKLIASLGHANTKQQLWAPAINAIFRKAQKLDNVFRSASEEYEVSAINVVFQDGLPADGLQVVTSYAAQVGSGLKSHRTAIKEMTGWNDELVDEELELIVGEQVIKTDTVSQDTDKGKKT